VQCDAVYLYVLDVFGVQGRALRYGTEAPVVEYHVAPRHHTHREGISVEEGREREEGVGSGKEERERGMRRGGWEREKNDEYESRMLGQASQLQYTTERGRACVCGALLYLVVGHSSCVSGIN
jgi:hypothetical protein